MSDRRWISTAAYATTALLVFGLFGCGHDKVDQGQGNASPGESASSAPADNGPPVTDAECRAFAESLEKAAAEGNAQVFNDLIDWDAMLTTATEGIDAPASSRNAFIRGVKGSVTKPGGFVEQIIPQINNGATYTPLRIHRQAKRRSALFRLLMPSEGVNYHDYILARSPAGRLRAVDIFIFLTAEPLSQTFRQIYMPVAANDSRGFLAKVAGIAGPEQEFVKNLPKFTAMTDAKKAGRNQQVLDIYSQLPEGLRQNKTFLMLRFQAAQALDEKAYFVAIEDFRKYHPDDPCVDFLSIDYFLMKKQYPEAIACVDRVEKALGGDPYLDVMRANLHMVEGKLDEAEKDGRNAIKREPTLTNAYETLLNISLKKKNYDETLSLLKTLRDERNVPIEDLTKISEYAGFVKSPQYAKWKASAKPSQRSTQPKSAEPKTK